MVGVTPYLAISIAAVNNNRYLSTENKKVGSGSSLPTSIIRALTVSVSWEVRATNAVATCASAIGSE